MTGRIIALSTKRWVRFSSAQKATSLSLTHTIVSVVTVVLRRENPVLTAVVVVTARRISLCQSSKKSTPQSRVLS
jgi:hypothetical protein